MLCQHTTRSGPSRSFAARSLPAAAEGEGVAERQDLGGQSSRTVEMAFSPTHAMLAVAIGSVWVPKPALRVFLIAGAICAVLPDVDLLAPLLWASGREFHRTVTHSLFFAVLVGAVATMCLKPLMPGHRTRKLVLYLALATASHGILDALTTHEMDVAFFSPVSGERYVALWRPIDSRFVEFWFVLTPCVVVTCFVLRIRGIGLRLRTREAASSIRIDKCMRRSAADRHRYTGDRTLHR
jgi:inner membrane protein